MFRARVRLLRPKSNFLILEKYTVQWNTSPFPPSLFPPSLPLPQEFVYISTEQPWFNVFDCYQTKTTEWKF